MDSSSSFTLFPELPTEIRLQIWDSVPRPARIIGHVPCHNCIDNAIPGDCKRSRHPSWTDHYTIQPRDQAIHPLLKTCRESRAALLRRYIQPQRYMPELELRFDTPFINYDEDIFAVYEEHIPGRTYDPFMGLDRRRIRHVAFSEIPGFFVESLMTLNIPSLQNLESFSLLICGPSPPVPRTGVHSWLQTRKPYISFQNYQVRDIPHALYKQHPFFGRLRPRHPFVTLDPRAQAVADYMILFKAWLWHAQSWDPAQEIDWTEDPWWDFLEYVYDDAISVCPLDDLPGCGGASGHSKKEMLEWEPPFELGCKVICERQWLEKLDTLKAFEIDPEGKYESFGEFLREHTAVGTRAQLRRQ